MKQSVRILNMDHLPWPSQQNDVMLSVQFLRGGKLNRETHLLYSATASLSTVSPTVIQHQSSLGRKVSRVHFELTYCRRDNSMSALPKLLWNTNRKSYVFCPTAPSQMTLDYVSRSNQEAIYTTYSPIG